MLLTHFYHYRVRIVNFCPRDWTKAIFCFILLKFSGPNFKPGYFLGSVLFQLPGQCCQRIIIVLVLMLWPKSVLQKPSAAFGKRLRLFCLRDNFFLFFLLLLGLLGLQWDCSLFNLLSLFVQLLLGLLLLPF